MAKKKKPGALAAAVQAPPERPSTDAFLDHLFREMGGPAAVARFAYEEFRAAKAGSLFRLRFIESLLRTLKSVDAKSTTSESHALLTDEDLELLIAERERRILAQLPETRDDPAGPQPSPEPPPAVDGPPADPPAFR